MNIGRFIITAVISIGYLITSMAQQVWPIKVTGALVPPHSLNLGVYGAERTQDLTFNAILIDPVQASLQVRLSLSIEQNGNVIYQTDPNYLGMPITLSQFQNVLIDGNALRSYLTPQALTGARGVGTGSLEIPEGFNQICMQLYGVDKNVPLSNKFCMSGNFRLNQPPIFVKPACGEKIKMAPTQNMIFNWNAMHLGSANSPGAVEYEYELVQLPQGTFNANDAFDSGLKVYKTKSLTPTIIYTQAEPRLVPNVVYAWRVRASSMLHPTSKLFLNDGLSQICTFMLYDGDMPDDNINPTNNPSPMGCSVYSTEYGTIDKSEQISQSLIDGDVVKVGYFNMKIQSVSGGTDGYSGKGLIEYPMLKSMIPVTFSGIKINSERRVYASDRIEAAVSPSCALTDAQLKESQIGNYINNSYFTSKLLPEMDRSNNYVVDLDVNSPKVNTLPIAMGAGGAVPTIYVIGIQFTPTNAFLNLAGLQTDAADNISGIYAATAIQATPYGLKNGSYLVPVGQSSGNGNAVSIIPSIDLIQSSDGGSRITCDCNGYLEAKLKNALQISPDIIVRSDNGGPVVLDLKETKTDKETYFGESKKLPEFEFKGLQKFKFSANRVFVDLSNTAVIENSAKYNTADKNIVDPNWKGVIIQDASVTLPESFNILNNKTPLVLDQGEILINENSIPFARFSKNNLIGIEQGKVENWKYSVDKYTLNIENNTVVGPSISGQIKLPISEDPMSYTGELLQSGNGNARMNIAMPTENLKIDMWSANMSLFKESYIGLEIKNLGNEKMMYPSAKLSGDLNIKVSNTLLADKIKGNVAQTLADIKQALGVQTDDLSFSVSKLNMNNWNLSPYESPENKYTASSVDVDKARFEMGGKSFDVTHGEVLKRTKDNKEQVGMSVVIKEGNNKINFILWGAENNGAFALDQIEAKIIDIRCNCTVEPSGIGKVELQKLYDKLIDEAYADIAQSAGPSSGKQSSELYNNTEFQLFHAKMKSELEVNTTEGGWIVTAGKVKIPFLDIEIKVTQDGNKLVGVIDSSFFIPQTLPMTIDSALFEKLGFHTPYNLPKNSSFYITDLTIPDIDKPEGSLTFGIVTLNMGSDWELESASFKSEPVPITNSPTNGIKIADLKLKLESDFPKNRDYVFKASSTENEKIRQSIARVDCQKGFDHFDMTGLYTPQNLVAVGKDTLNMLFTLNTSLPGNTHDLYDFIGVLSDKNNKDEKWKFNLPNEPYLIFTTGESFSMYLDLSERLKVPGNTASKSFKEATSVPSFKGIVFEKMSFEILGFNGKDGNHEQFPISDVVYEAAAKGEQKGLNTSYFKDNKLIPRDIGGKFSGWRYELESASFTIANNSFQYSLEIDGKLLVPLFKANPKKTSAVKFSDPWVGFSGTVFSDKEGKTTNVYSNFLLENIVDSTYLSDFIPGLGFLINEGSSVEMEFDYQEKEWALSGEFNGRAILIINSETVGDIGLKNWPEGMDFSYQAMRFKGLKINKGDTGCGSDLSDQYGIGDIEFGEWGVLDDTKDIRESLKEKKDDSSEPEAKDKTSGQDKTNSQPATSGRRRSNANYGGDAPKQENTTTRKRSNALVNKDPRRPTVKGRARSNAQYGGKAPKQEKPTPEPEFNAMSLSVEVTGIKCIDAKTYELGLDITVNILGDNEDQGSTTQGSTTQGSPAQGSLAKASPAKASPAKATSTCAINAAGGLGVRFAIDKGKLKYDDIVLNCLKFGGSIGPVKFDGGLNILRATKEQTQWGQGFKAYLKGGIEGLGGLAMVGQFGKIKYTKDGVDEKYTYGFLDIEAFVQAGIPVPTPVPSVPPIVPVVDIYGVGGGLRINMELQTAAQELEMKENPAVAPSNDNCTLPGDLLATGKGFSNNFLPKKGTYGGNIYIIFGPWNELDIFSPPQYQLVSDVGFDIQIGRDEKGAMQFNSVYINAKAYIKPESIGTRRDNNIADAYANIGYDNRLKKVVGDFGFRAKLDVPKAGTILQMPINHPKYNKGYMDICFKPMSFSVKFGGPGYNGWKPTSGLSRLDAILSVPNVVDVSAFAYFQIGKDVDPVTPLEYLIPKLKDAKNKEEVPKDRGNDALNRAANGIAFGANINLKSNLSYGPMSANLDAGIGFDLNLSERKGVTCANLNNSEIGIKGWYAIGQAYAYANGKIDLNYNLLFTSGRVKIFDVNGFMYLKAMLPNPAYMKGRLKGDYTVLNGLLSGEFNYKIEFGQQCEGILPPSPIEGMEIFANANIEKGQTGVDRYTDIQVATNLALQQDFDLPQLNAEGEISSTASYHADLKEIYLVKKGSTTKIQNLMTRNSNKKGFKLEFNSPLDAQTDYEINYTFVWLKKEAKNGAVSYIENFESKQGDKVLKPKIETGIISFKTGDLPQNIQNTMVEYVAPGNKQRYWHKGYADTELKFKLNALADAATLFPDECIVCTQANGGKKVDFEYFVQLIEHDDSGKPIKTYRIPVTSRPSKSELAKILNWEKVSLNNGEYHLNVLTETERPVSKVSFPGLNDIELVKGSLYELKIVRKPKMEAQQNVKKSDSNQKFSQLQNSEISDITEEVVFVTVREEKNELAKMSPALSKAINENTKILYTSHFAVSNYNTLQDKLALVEVKHQRSVTKRRDFEHPNDAYDQQRATAIQSFGESKFHSTKDDYYVLNIKNGNLEGFDEFDLNRIRRNASLKYNGSYTAEDRLYGERYYDFANQKKQDIPAKVVSELHSQSIFLGYSINRDSPFEIYMKKVLFDYREAENKGVATYGNNRFSDGTKWHYNISMPDDPKAKLLQDDEIRDGKVIHKSIGYKSTNDPNYSKPVFGNEVEFDLLIQDLRSRIIISQMVWLSKISKNSQYDPWFKGNYPEGEFLNETRTTSDFNWVLYPNQGAENSKTVSPGTYIAKEPGYQFSYHGTSTLSFPADTKWGEITESKRDKNQGAASNTFATLTPVRELLNYNEELPVDNYTELLVDSWYKIKYKGRPLFVNKSNPWGNNANDKWGLDYPHKSHSYKSGQYGIYSGIKGKFLSGDDFRDWAESRDNDDTVWNIVGTPGSNKARIGNERIMLNNGNANLTYQLVNIKRDRLSKINGTDDLWIDVTDNEFELVELPELGFSPEKFYLLSSNGWDITDDQGGKKWRILRDGKFYKFISANGIALKGHYYTSTGFFKTNEYYQLILKDGFPTNKNDINDYQRSIWDITQVSTDPKIPRYIIRNVRYQDHFIGIREGGGVFFENVSYDNTDVKFEIKESK